MESGWLVNSILSRSDESAAASPIRSYQISPIAPPWRALLQGRKSEIPQGFARARARACSIATDFYLMFNRDDDFRRRAPSKSLNRQHRLRNRSWTDGRRYRDAGSGCERREKLKEKRCEEAKDKGSYYQPWT